MTVTLDLDPAILARIQAMAVRDGRTVEQLVHDALDRALGPTHATFSPKMGQNPDVLDPHPDWRYENRDGTPLPFPVFYGGTPGNSAIDWTNNESIYAALYEEDDERIRRWSTGESPDL